MRTDRLALILTAALASPAAADTVELISRYAWETEVIAGISGIEVSGDGMRFTAIGDRGFWITGTFERDGEILSGVTLDRVAAIVGMDGHPVAARRLGDWSDAEGLAIAPDGTTWVSFERWAHVWRYDDGLDGRATFIEDHPTFAEHAENWQLEAAAISPEGVVYTFSEKPLLDGFPVYELTPNGWTISATLPERDLFAIVGADFDANGDLYLLERKLIMGFWWQSRIRRVKLDGSEDRTLWTSDRGDFGNLEGLALWRRNDALILTTVSDNNNRDEPTEFVEFRLVVAPEDEPGPTLDVSEPEG